MEQNNFEQFIDKFIDDVIIGEGNLNSSAYNYFKDIIRNTEYSWIHDMYVERKEALNQIDENDPEFINGKEEIYRTMGFDTQAYLYAIKEYKLQYLKKIQEEKINKTI